MRVYAIVKTAIQERYIHRVYSSRKDAMKELEKLIQKDPDNSQQFTIEAVKFRERD